MKMVPETGYGRDKNPEVEVEVPVRLQQGMEGQASQRNHHATNGTLRGTVMRNRGVLVGSVVCPRSSAGSQPEHEGTGSVRTRGMRRSEEGSWANYSGAKRGFSKSATACCRRAQVLFMAKPRVQHCRVHVMALFSTSRSCKNTRAWPVHIQHFAVAGADKATPIEAVSESEVYLPIIGA